MSQASNEIKEKKSLRQEYAEEGCLNASFTQKSWFVKIKPAYNIDKVAFHFVLKGSSGKQSFAVYVDIDTFDLWMEDVKSYRLAKVIAEEQKNGEKYPKTYKAVCGENGSFSVGFCASSKFPNMYVINGNGKHKENGVAVGEMLHASVPVSYEWLRITAKYFERTSRKRFAELSETTVRESMAWHSPDQGVVSDESPESNSCRNESAEGAADKPKPTQPANKNDTANNSSPESKNAKSGENKQNKGSSPSSAPNAQEKPTKGDAITYNEKSCKKMEIDIKTPLIYDGSHYRLQALNPKGEQQNIVITKGISEQLGDKFTNLEKACKQATATKNYIHITMLYRTGTYENANVIFLEKIME